MCRSLSFHGRKEQGSPLCYANSANLESEVDHDHRAAHVQVLDDGTAALFERQVSIKQRHPDTSGLIPQTRCDLPCRTRAASADVEIIGDEQSLDWQSDASPESGDAIPDRAGS